MSEKTTAAELLDLKEYGRCTVDGTEYVAFWDGAYTSVVSAADWDAEIDAADYPTDEDERELREETGISRNAYDVWCGRVDIVRDEIVLQAMANKIDALIFDGCSFTEPA